ncbi:MAG: helicase SNF2 [Methylomonas sp.]|nr:MAG: helicase SNF2 [Methylomonas sp.]PPD26699.1 MAG: helicase SNF2 [Methylomonas sp.]PPD38519.1 MAG: helicase SNF2 [Methylomonas sp.]PPD40158.1 MAG: helicase SNF2 [Methylomonas sp.]PPD55754.1 MAG: helicase SNF2 [Methylomonas sp.]
MHSSQLDKSLDGYQKLAVDQQVVVNLLAVYYGYASLATIGKCLAELGIKEGSRVLKTESVRARLKPLISSGLLEENARPGGIRCVRGLAEFVTRRLVADQIFERYVVVIVRCNPLGTGYYRYQTTDDCIRDARIHFHRGDHAQVNNCVEVGRRHPGNLLHIADLYLSWLLHPLDAVWLQRQHESVLPELLAEICLHQIVYLYQAPEVDALCRQQTEKDSGRQHALFVRRWLELKWLRGEWGDVAALTVGAEDPELIALAAAIEVLKGRYVEAIALFDAALVALRKQSGKKQMYFFGLAGVFYPLALLKLNDGKQHSKLSNLLIQAAKQGGHWAATYQYLYEFQQYLQGAMAARDNLLAAPRISRVASGFRESGAPDTVLAPPLMQQVLLLLIKFWTKADFMDEIDAVEQKLYSHLVNNGYVWPAAELAKLFGQLQPARASRWDARFFQDDRLALADMFVSRADWEISLDALLHLPINEKSSERSVQGEKPSRLAWLVTLVDGGRLQIEPREQKQQAKGGWSKGRAVALKRLAQEASSFDYLSEQDLKICTHIKEYRESGWYGSGTFYEFDNNTPLALVGHPSLFLGNAQEVRVDIIKGETELQVKKLPGGNAIKITLEPIPYPGQTLHIIKETPTRLRVVEFTDDHYKVLGVLGSQGLEVPVSAQDRVLQALTGISGLLTVHSDIGGSASSAEQIEADATLRIHLLPHDAGLRIALLTRPFRDEGAYFQPGQGGESVLAEIAGRRVQTRRDLQQERQWAAAAIEACPVLLEAERDDGGDWLLAHPEACLEFLLQAQALPQDQAMLEWPEGVRFKLLGQANGQGMTVQIKRDHDWFALQGQLKVDDDTVLDMQQLLGLLDNRQGRFLQLNDGQFVALTDEFRRRLEELKAYADISGKKIRLNPLAALTLEDWQDRDGFTADQHWQQHIQRLNQARDYQPTLPSTFQAELRDYQMDGYCWLARLAQWGVGACLADDMGLGKTVQGLALLVERAPLGPGLIVAPTSVCMNWENEARRFAPTLNPKILGVGDRQKLLDNLQPFDLLICSYGLLQQESVADALAKVAFGTAILDEAQAIKNIATRRSQGAMNLQAGFRIIMTGTPLENHLGELWNLYRFINPGLLGSLEQFNQRFAGPIERDRSTEARYLLKKLIQPFILRRTKTQVLQELPPRTEIPVYVELSSEETTFYEALRRDALQALEAPGDTNAGARHLQILAAITKLRRSCCNTRLANPAIALPSSKLAAFGEIVDELLANKHKALVFSQFVDHLQLIRDYVEQRGIVYQYLDGSTPARERQQRVDAFQRGEGELFLISLKAGGVGLNLTAADYVIHMDPWWNPAVEDQASDRAHRMGQQRPVTIYRMIARQTIEEKIVALHSHKRDLADSLLEGADMSGKVSADDLLNLMKSNL